MLGKSCAPPRSADTSGRLVAAAATTTWYVLALHVTSRYASPGIPERSIKRRFKQATGALLIEYIHNLCIEEAKRLLEQTDQPVGAMGYQALPSSAERAVSSKGK